LVITISHWNGRLMLIGQAARVRQAENLQIRHQTKMQEHQSSPRSKSN